MRSHCDKCVFVVNFPGNHYWETVALKPLLFPELLPVDTSGEKETWDYICSVANPEKKI